MDILDKRQMIEELSVPYKCIEIRRHIREIDAIFLKIRVQFVKTLFALSGNQFAKNAKMQQIY